METVIPILVGGLVVLAVGVWAHRAYDRALPSSRGRDLPDRVYRIVMSSAFALILVGVAATVLGAMWLMTELS